MRRFIELPSLVLPLTNDNLDTVNEIIKAGPLALNYKTKSTSDDNFEQVVCRPARLIQFTLFEADAFDGTIEEYRAQPKSRADLVADLSAKDDEINDLRQQLDEACRTAIRQAAE